MTFGELLNKALAWVKEQIAAQKTPGVGVDNPIVNPASDPVVGPKPNASAWRGCMFVPATPGFPNNRGVSSQLEYRGIHGQSNEDAQRLDMFQNVKKWGGNTLVYIRGEFCRPNQVLDMCLNGRKHPGDGHYFPINGKAESDFAMWGKQQYGIDHHICFVWNDNKATPFTEAIVKEAVEAYDGTRLGLGNVAFGVCLETDEDQVMPDPAIGAKACGWIKKYAPNSPCILGSANPDYLLAVAGRVSNVYLWLEQKAKDSPVINPLTRSTFPEYKASLDKLAAKVGKGHVIPGEWWAANSDDVRWMTQQLQSAGYENFGSGKHK